MIFEGGGRCGRRDGVFTVGLYSSNFIFIYSVVDIVVNVELLSCNFMFLMKPWTLNELGVL